MSWDTIYFGNALGAWATSFGMVLLTMLLIRTFLGIAIKRVKALSKKTETDLDDLAVQLLDKTRTLFVFLIALWLGARPLALPDEVETVIRATLIIGLLLQAGFWGNGAIAYVVGKYRASRSDDPGFAMAVGAIGVIGKLAMWSLLVLTFLGSMDVNVSAFVASLGIGGLAVALALQTVLGDLLGSLSIIFDKPFVIGDFISVGDMSGTVEHVGLKTTRVRSISGEQLVFSNSDLLASRVRNYGRMEQRRCVFQTGASYGTPPEKLQAIPAIVQEVVEAQTNTRFDRCHFRSMGDFSLDFETVYYMEIPDYAAFMDTQQAINLGIYERFAAEGIDFPFPTQSLHVESMPAN